jgi:protein-tyrosine phosphatase
LLHEALVGRELVQAAYDNAVQLFEHGYREMVSAPSALSGYRLVFPDLARSERRPALSHCTTGQDRTGWAAAVLLTLLGGV